MELIRGTQDIYYVGVQDETIDLFEDQYMVPQGISYNSYVIRDSKIAVMDTVDERGTDVWFDSLEEVLDGKAPDYLVIHHMEPDHSANIVAFMAKYPETKLVGNAKTFTFMKQFFGENFEANQVVIKEGDTLELGAHTLKFVMAPMVHWPEVFVSYDEASKTLFSADAFGKFGVPGVNLYDNQSDWKDEARRYYINIVGKYGAMTTAFLKKASALDIEHILPLHGPVLDQNLSYYLNLYKTWGSYAPERKGTVILAASTHGNMVRAAERFAEILKGRGEEVLVFDVNRDDPAEMVAEMFAYDKAVIATITYDGGLMPAMMDMLYRLKHKGYQNRKVGIIESGTWGPVAARIVRAELEGCKNLTVAEKTVTILSAMNEKTEGDFIELADELLG